MSAETVKEAVRELHICFGDLHTLGRALEACSTLGDAGHGVPELFETFALAAKDICGRMERAAAPLDRVRVS